MRMIEDRTRIGTRDCIKFKQRINEKNYLKIENHVECNSLIGRFREEKPQIVNLNRDIFLFYYNHMDL